MTGTMEKNHAQALCACVALLQREGAAWKTSAQEPETHFGEPTTAVELLIAKQAAECIQLSPCLRVKQTKPELVFSFFFFFFN